MDELRRLSWTVVAIKPDHLVVLIRRSKTDQLRHCNIRLIPSLPSALVCPVQVFVQYRDALLGLGPIPTVAGPVASASLAPVVRAWPRFPFARLVCCLFVVLSAPD